MIGVEYHGRFGNNLFQYALARIIQKKTGWELVTWNGNRDLKSRYGINIENGEPKFENQEHFPACPSSIPGVCLPDPVTIREHDFASVDAMIDHSAGRGIILHGFFQRWKYYVPFMKAIREWFALPDLPVVDSEAWVMHIRRGDYIGGQELPMEYYERVLLEYVPVGAPVTFVGDAEPAFVSKLMGLWEGSQHLCGASMTDFRFIAAHKNIACSNSTFARWASWLSNAEKIIIPRPAKGKYWCEGSAQDLFVPGTADILVEC